MELALGVGLHRLNVVRCFCLHGDLGIWNWAMLRIVYNPTYGSEDRSERGTPEKKQSSEQLQRALHGISFSSCERRARPRIAASVNWEWIEEQADLRGPQQQREEEATTVRQSGRFRPNARCPQGG